MADKVTYNKEDLVKHIRETQGLKKADAEKAVKGYNDFIAKVIGEGNSIQQVGFGTFEVRTRAARKGRNPQTGEEIEIPASVAPAFKPGGVLRNIAKGL